MTGGARCEEGASKVILGFYLTWMFLGAACEKNRRRRRRPFLNVPSSKTSPSWQGQVPRPKSQRTNGASKNPGTHRHRECVEAFFSLVPLLFLAFGQTQPTCRPNQGPFSTTPQAGPPGPRAQPGRYPARDGSGKRGSRDRPRGGTKVQGRTRLSQASSCRWRRPGGGELRSPSLA